ncbi:hypothetical protein RFZ44_02835, partial [Acinetobacter sp. 163]|nr:hypothetical protein [Acinetobacter sp. 163]
PAFAVYRPKAIHNVRFFRWLGIVFAHPLHRRRVTGLGLNPIAEGIRNVFCLLAGHGFCAPVLGADVNGGILALAENF